MRRGHILEQRIDEVITHLNSVGIHAHKNHVRRMVTGIYLEGESFDYEVFSHGKLTCFDAKECNAKRWNLKNAKRTQVMNLLNCQKHGADAFFLVYFVPENKLVRIDVDIVHIAIFSGIKSLVSSDGVIWNWEDLILGRSKKDRQRGNKHVCNACESKR